MGKRRTGFRLKPVQVTVHEGVISNDDLLLWVRTAASAELGLPISAFINAL